ncbi:MAG: hypothetical protein U0R76_16570 [Candidatus Nanopelagicales bacterium]
MAASAEPYEVGGQWILAGAAVLLALAVVGARWGLSREQRTWPTTALSVAVVALSTLSSDAVLVALRVDPGTGTVHPTTSLLWAGLLVVLATAALVMVDRRTRSSDVEPADDPADVPEM